MSSCLQTNVFTSVRMLPSTAELNLIILHTLRKQTNKQTNEQTNKKKLPFIFDFHAV